MGMDKISVIVSCYNEKESLPLFYEEIIFKYTIEGLTAFSTKSLS